MVVQYASLCSFLYYKAAEIKISESDGCLFLLPGTICYHYQHANRFDQGTDVYLLMLCSFLYFKATKIKISESDGVHYLVMLIVLTGVLMYTSNAFVVNLECIMEFSYVSVWTSTGFCAVTVILLIFPFLFLCHFSTFS